MEWKDDVTIVPKQRRNETGVYKYDAFYVLCFAITIYYLKMFYLFVRI